MNGSSRAVKCSSSTIISASASMRSWPACEKRGCDGFAECEDGGWKMEDGARLCCAVLDSPPYITAISLDAVRCGGDARLFQCRVWRGTNEWALRAERDSTA